MISDAREFLNAVWKKGSVFEDEYKEMLKQLFDFSMKSAKVMIRN